MTRTPLWLILVLLATLVACGGSEKKSQSSASPQPVSRHNPIIQGTPDKNVGHHITLKPDALKQRFLMNTTFSHQGFPMPIYLWGKVVRFKKRGSELFMFESRVGKIYANTVKEPILARFPIVGESSDGAITFDFEKGMKLFLAMSAGLDPSAYPISQSYVENVQLKESHITIEHSIRIVQSGDGRSVPLSLRYSLSSYNPDPSFKPSLFSQIHGTKVGYLSAPPIYLPGQPGPSTFVRKHNPRNFPITYYISSNTPQALVPVITEGILYWNKILGQEIVKVEILPKNIDPRDPGNHIVHWLENIENFSQFAGVTNSAIDPLTGEILASRIFLPAHIIISNQKQAQSSLLNNTFEQPTTENDMPAPVLPDNSANTIISKLVSHQRPHNCQLMNASLERFHFQQFQSQLSRFAKKYQMNPMQVAYYSQMIARDKLRMTVAHEVGHALGLDHNYAASTQTDLTPENYNEIVQSYIKKGRLPENFQVASSLMDYTPFMVAAFQGAHIRHKQPPPSYDRDAIRYLYLKEGHPLSFSSPFCTDEHFTDTEDPTRSVYEDCNRFDTFSNPTAWHYHQLKEYAKAVPSKIIRTYQYLQKSLQQAVSTSTKVTYDPFDFIEKHPLTPQRDAAILTYFFDRLADSISRGAEFIQIAHEYFAITGLNRNDYTEKTKALINQNIAEFGSISQLLLSHLSPPAEENEWTTLQITARMEQQFKTYLDDMADNPAVSPFAATMIKQKGGTLLDHGSIQEIIDGKIKKYIRVFEKEFILRNAQRLQGKQFAVADESFAENLSSLVERIIFAKSPQVLDSFAGVDFYSPQFEYITQELYQRERGREEERQQQKQSNDLRREALALLAHDFYPEDPHYKKEIEEFTKDIYNLHRDEIKDLLAHKNELPDRLYNWVFFEEQRFSQLEDLLEISGAILSEEENITTGTIPATPTETEKTVTPPMPPPTKKGTGSTSVTTEDDTDDTTPAKTTATVLGTTVTIAQPDDDGNDGGGTGNEREEAAPDSPDPEEENAASAEPGTITIFGTTVQKP